MLHCQSCNAPIKDKNATNCSYCGSLIIKEEKFIENEAGNLEVKSKNDDHFIAVARQKYESKRYDDVIDITTNGLESNKNCSEGWGLLALARAQSISASNFEKNFLSIEACCKRLMNLEKKNYSNYFNEIYDLLLDNMFKVVKENIAQANKTYFAYDDEEKAIEMSRRHIFEALENIKKVDDIFGEKNEKNLKCSIYSIYAVGNYNGGFHPSFSVFYDNALDHYKKALSEDQKFLDNLLSKMDINQSEKAKLTTTNKQAKGCNFFKTYGGKKVTSIIKIVLVYILLIPILAMLLFSDSDDAQSGFIIIAWIVYTVYLIKKR